LFIDGKELIENDGNHAPIEETCSIGLKAGYHEIDVKYFQCGGGYKLKLSWEGNSLKKHEILPSELFLDISK